MFRKAELLARADSRIVQLVCSDDKVVISTLTKVTVAHTARGAASVVSVGKKARYVVNLMSASLTPNDCFLTYGCALLRTGIL